MPAPRPDEIARAPQAYRDACAEMLQFGLRVGRLVAQVADEEMALAKAATLIRAAEAVSTPPESLAQAIEVDRATLAAHEARAAVVERTGVVATAFAKVERAFRQTVLLGERLECRWGGRAISDSRCTMARRQIKRAVDDAILREAGGERAERLNDALSERLESLDLENELADRPAADIIGEICRELGLTEARMTECSARQDAARPAEAGKAAPPAGGDTGWAADPWRRRPDG